MGELLLLITLSKEGGGEKKKIRFDTRKIIRGHRGRNTVGSETRRSLERKEGVSGGGGGGLGPKQQRRRGASGVVEGIRRESGD